MSSTAESSNAPHEPSATLAGDKSATTAVVKTENISVQSVDAGATATTTANATSSAKKKEDAPSAKAAVNDLDDPNAVVPIDEAGLEDEDDDFATSGSPTSYKNRRATSELFSKGGLNICWSNITYKVVVPDNDAGVPGATKVRTILDNLSGNAVPGRVLAIMGPSGAGKSSVIGAFTGRLIMADECTLDGVVYLNDVVMTEAHKPIVSFVCQDDIVMPKETPLDAFRFSAAIRDSDMTDEDAELKAQSMVRDLKLTLCKDTVMGVPGLIKGLSGGEKRRTNIGSALVNEPMAVIFDEPTSGLDSVAAYRIGKLMRALARQGRTIICTIHSPSSELFGLFDDLWLLAQGKTVYHGPANALRDYFFAIGKPMPERINPSEYAMKLVQSENPDLPEYFDAWLKTAEKVCPGSTARIPAEAMRPILLPGVGAVGTATTVVAASSSSAAAAAAAASSSSKTDDHHQHGSDLYPSRRQSSVLREQFDACFEDKHGELVRRSLRAAPTDVKEHNEVVDELLRKRKPASLLHQLKLVSARSWRNVVRDPMLTVARLGQTVVFAIFIGLMYYELNISSTAVQDRQGLLFLFMIQNTFLSLMPGLLAFPPELAVYLQDQADALYSPGVFYVAKTIVELPINTAAPTLFAIIIYFMSNLARTAEQFFIFYCTTIVLGWTANALGMLIGAFAGRKPEAAFVYAPLVVMPMAFVAGLFANTDRLEPGWVWLEYISFARYAYKNYVRTEFENIGQICTPGPTCRYPTGPDVVRFLGFDQYETDKWGYSILFLCIIMLVFRILGVIALYYQAWKQLAELVFLDNYKRLKKVQQQREGATGEQQMKQIQS